MHKEDRKTELEKKLEAELAAQASRKTAETPAPQPAESAAPDHEPAQLDPAALAQALEAKTAECEEYKDMLLRTRAEFDNYRKRMQRDAERLRKTATESLIRDLLPVLDNLERALAHADEASPAFVEGVAMVLTQLRECLAARGLEVIPAAGCPFDPGIHEALSQMPSEEYPAGVVTGEYQRGYRIGDYLVRPAKVVVSGGPPKAPAEVSAPESSPPLEKAENLYETK